MTTISTGGSTDGPGLPQHIPDPGQELLRIDGLCG
jgi:hypothetical protein